MTSARDLAIAAATTLRSNKKIIKDCKSLWSLFQENIIILDILRFLIFGIKVNYTNCRLFLSE